MNLPYDWLPVPNFDTSLSLARLGLEKLALTQKELVAAGKETDTAPTEAQREAGNYSKGKVAWKGLTISIESPKGSYRSGVTKAGKPWRTLMRDFYGYVRGHVSAADGDHVDVFLASDGDPRSELVFIVNQIEPTTGKFDEHKCVLFAVDEESARAVYARNYQQGWQGLKSIVPLTLPQFRWWLEHGDTSKEIKDSYFAAPANRKKAAGLIQLVKYAADEKAPYTVAIDLDGTLAEQQKPFNMATVGPPRPGARKLLEDIHAAGARIIIFTVRGDTAPVKKWLLDHDMPFHFVNENPDQPKGSSGKIYASLYIDDRAIDGTELDEASTEALSRIAEREEP